MNSGQEDAESGSNRLAPRRVAQAPNAEPCEVLLVTVNDAETRAVLEVAEAITGRPTRPQYGEEYVYRDLGEIGWARVKLVRSGMGTTSPGAALETTLKACQEVNPRAVIAVGVAFGFDRKKQPIGQVLVSQQVQAYEPQRVGIDLSAHFRLEVCRGDRSTASTKLLNIFRDSANDWHDSEVKFGLLLSGEKLIDNADFRDQLRSQFNEALGGEMEAAGVYAAARKLDWIIVKAVCDWADGNKGRNKRERQHKAAKLAASFVLETISRGGLDYGRARARSGKESAAGLARGGLLAPGAREWEGTLAEPVQTKRGPTRLSYITNGLGIAAALAAILWTIILASGVAALRQVQDALLPVYNSADIPLRVAYFLWSAFVGLYWFAYQSEKYSGLLKPRTRKHRQYAHCIPLFGFLAALLYHTCNALRWPSLDVVPPDNLVEIAL